MTKQQASQIINSYTNEKIVNLNSIENRGSVNQVYIVETINSKYILRIDLNENDTNRFLKELWCTKSVQKLGVISPEIFTVGLDSGHPYMIMSYIEGINGDESNEKDKIWKTLGIYAKKIHSIYSQGFGEEMSAPGVFNDSWERYLNYNINSLNLDDKVLKLGVITETQSEQIKQIFINLKEKKFKFGVTHYDLSLKNTILTKNGKVCLIDWGSAIIAPVPYLDFAEILDSSLDENSHEFALFLEGYELTYKDYEKLKPDISQLNLLIHMDKLRWAIDRKKDKIDYFSKELKNKFIKVI